MKYLFNVNVKRLALGSTTPPRWGSVVEWIRELDWRPGDPLFESRCGNLIRFGTLALPFTPLCQCLSEEILKTVGPFYLVWCLCQGRLDIPPCALEMCNLSWTSPHTLRDHYSIGVLSCKETCQLQYKTRRQDCNGRIC